MSLASGPRSCVDDCEHSGHTNFELAHLLRDVNPRPRRLVPFELILELVLQRAELRLERRLPEGWRDIVLDARLFRTGRCVENIRLVDLDLEELRVEIHLELPATRISGRRLEGKEQAH